VNDFANLVAQLERRIASDLVHQQIHMLYAKYSSDPDRLFDYSELLDEYRKESAPLLKPLGYFEYEKVFHLHLLNSIGSSTSKAIFHKELKRVLYRGV
jgi:hypothetical protein